MRLLPHIKAADLYWLAGLLEGEGSFLAASPSAKGRPNVQIAMTDEDVIYRVATLWGATVSCKKWDVAANPRAARWKTCFTTRISGRRAVELMVKIHQFMGARRQEQIVAALKSWQTAPRPRKLTRTQGAEILKRSKKGETAAQLAAEYNVSMPSVYAVRQHRYFGWLDSDIVKLHAVVAQMVRAPSR